MIAIVNIIALIVLAFLVGRREDANLRPYYWPALGAKLAAGLGVGLIYRYYYSGGDTFDLFDEAARHAAQFHDQPAAWFHFMLVPVAEEWKGSLRASFLIKIISLMNICTGNDYWITSLWFSFVAFFSSWYFFKRIVSVFDRSVNVAAIAFLFLPSVVFWTSGILKDTIAMAGFYPAIAVWLGAMTRKRPALVEWIAALAGIWFVWNLKYYWLAVFLPIAVISLAAEYSREASGWRYAGLGVLAVVVVAGVQFLHPNFYPEHFLKVIVDNHDASILASAPGNVIHYHDLRPEWSSILVNVPWALFSGLFQPLPGQTHGLISWVSAIENSVILVLTVTVCISSGAGSSPFRLIGISVLVYTIILAVFLALSTPNLGTLARYKAGFLPFWFFLIAYRNTVISRMTARFSRDTARV